MNKIVLLRHGESVWNHENRFTGWADVDLSERGLGEARAAGEALKAAGFAFDLAYTSMLKRANRTLWTALDAMDRLWLPVEHSWRLNERHYGALQGLNKAETAARYGDAQVLQWRRAFDIAPPAMSAEDPRYQGSDPRYAALAPGQVPLTECLRDTIARVIPYWEQTIAPQVQAGRQVLVVAHGNSLRALIKYLDGIDDAAIVDLNVPTGTPLVYELDDALRPLRHYYLGDPDAVAAAARAVADQGRAGT